MIPTAPKKVAGFPDRRAVFCANELNQSWRGNGGCGLESAPLDLRRDLAEGMGVFLPERSTPISAQEFHKPTEARALRFFHAKSRPWH
jgi:hypothetical protein